METMCDTGFAVVGQTFPAKVRGLTVRSSLCRRTAVFSDLPCLVSTDLLLLEGVQSVLLVLNAPPLGHPVLILILDREILEMVEAGLSIYYS